MSYEEKNTWAFGLIAPLGYAVYIALTFLVGDGPLDASSYMWPMLWAIFGAIVAGILAGILIGMSGGTPGRPGSRRVDYRDKEIGWLGSRVGNAFIVLGGIGALLLCFFQAPYPYIANVLYLAFVLAAILQSVTKLIAYRRGF